MRIYRALIRTVFAVIFILTGIGHMILGPTVSQRYAVFGRTALNTSMTGVWADFVMPNISWIALIIGFVFFAAGAGLLMQGHWVQISAAVLMILLFFDTFLGGVWLTATGLDSIIWNRVISFVMAILLFPVVLEAFPPRAKDMWKARAASITA